MTTDGVGRSDLIDGMSGDGTSGDASPAGRLPGGVRSARSLVRPRARTAAAALSAALSAALAALLLAPLDATVGAQEPTGGPRRATQLVDADSPPHAATPARVPDARRESLRLEASLSGRRIVVRRGGEVLAEYPVSVGRAGHDTPTGSFTIERMIWNPGWVPPDSPWARGRTAKEPGEPGNPMRVVKIFFQEPDYYIHGTNDRASLGRASSHGCLRMSPVSVAELARIVMEHGGAARDDDWFTEVIVGNDTRVVRLETPVEMVVVR